MCTVRLLLASAWCPIGSGDILHLICIQCPAKKGDSLCGGNEILTLGSNCLGGILTFEANTSASYCLCILTLPVPSQLSSCTGITSPLWSMSRLLGFSQFPSAYKPNLGTRWLCPNIPETDTDALVPTVVNQRKQGRKPETKALLPAGTRVVKDLFHHPSLQPASSPSLLLHQPAGAQAATSSHPQIATRA